jgi:uncharacterized alpha-E superfamily protein
MLSRTADHLFWMARYMERAENTARILDVTYQLTLLPRNGEDVENMWACSRSWSCRTPSGASQQQHRGRARFHDLRPGQPGQHLSLPARDRENAHAVRGTLTSEMWETTNGTWLKMRDFSPAKMLEAGRVISSSGSSIAPMSRGVTIGTMLQDEALRFIRLGTFLERADNTARILEVKYLNLLPGSDEEMQSADYYQWSALLRSVSAFEVYRRVYRDQINRFVSPSC